MYYEPKKKNKRSVWGAIGDGLAAVLTAAIVALWAGVWLGRVVPPDVWWVPSLMVLGAPLVYLGVVVAAGYWILRWRVWWIAATAVPLVYVLFSMGAFVQMPLWSNKGEDLRPELRVVSYNVHSFRNPHVGDSIQTARVASWLASTEADVVLLQEYEPPAVDTTRIAARTFDRWHYVASQTGAHQYEGAWGITVLSRYPIVRSRFLSYADATGGALAVDVEVEGDTVRLYNCHLQTTAFNEVNREEPLSALLDAPDRDVRAEGTLRALRDGFLRREAQTDSVALHIESSPYPVVVGGDLNAVPLSRTYYALKGDRDDAFREAGEGYGYTYRMMGRMLRIDFVFYDPEAWEATAYRSTDLPYSDHNPVEAVLKIKPKKQ